MKNENIKYTFYKSIADFSPCYKQGRKMNGLPTGIVIHSTGCKNPALGRWVKSNGTDAIHTNIFKNYFGGEGNGDVTPHAVAGLDEYGNVAIAQILPYTMMCYGCGSGKNGSYNTDHIQIEMAEGYYGNTDGYFDKIIDAVIQWCADLCEEFKIDVDEIVGHAEAHAAGYASNHGDPQPWFDECRPGYTMDKFRADVRDELTERAGKKPTNDATIHYVVQAGAFSSYENAKAHADKLKAAGFDCFVKIV